MYLLISYGKVNKSPIKMKLNKTNKLKNVYIVISTKIVAIYNIRSYLEMFMKENTY